MFSSKFQGMRATGRITLTVNRHTGSGGEYVNGKWVESATEPVELRTVNVQPLAYKETVLMEAADRSKKSLKVYSADPIYSQAENNIKPASNAKKRREQIINHLLQEE